MSRDYKPAKQRSAPEAGKKKSRGGTLLGVFVGLVVGVGAALAVVWYMNRAPMPFVNKAQVPTENGKSAATPAPAANAGAPAPLPGKPGDPPIEKRFTFYDILPGKSEAQPDGKPAAEKGAEKAGEKASSRSADTAKSGAEVQLQAGSFQNPKDAENLKATLALSGLEASVQQVMVGEKVWYRVRLGPYAKADEASKAKAELAKSGIEATVVKGKD